MSTISAPIITGYLPETDNSDVINNTLDNPPEHVTTVEKVADQRAPTTPTTRTTTTKTTTTTTPLGPLSIDTWWHISHHLTLPSDIFRLSRVNKTLWALLTPARALIEVSPTPTSSRPGPSRWPSCSCLDLAIRLGEPIESIETIIRVYLSSSSSSSSPSLIQQGGESGEGRTGTGTRLHEPPLHLAARYNRADVVEALLAAGCDVNTRWSGPWCDCHGGPHVRCREEVEVGVPED
ncbi:hypothetical protein F4778DRAFT_796755 [Xylariomycetidae sp. FL2044]|nr:hypothetical protein F4778DRAFT_796755 [Xylariomycetidae sp. FL2044]